MSLNNSLNNSVNEARIDKCESLLAYRCLAGKYLEPGHHQNAARTRWTKGENKTAISYYL